MQHYLREQVMASRFESAAIVLVLSACAAGAAYADDRTEYNRRAAARDVALFQALDRNGDGMLAREESRGIWIWGRASTIWTSTATGS